MPHSLTSRSLRRKLVNEGRLAPRTPFNEYASWPTDEKGNPMHPTKGFGKYSRSGKRGNRTAKRRTANRGPSPLVVSTSASFDVTINEE